MGSSPKKLFFFRPLGPQFGLKIRRAPPLYPPLLSKAPILQEMNDDAGIFLKKKAINVFITNNTKGSSNVYLIKIKAREKAKKQIPIGFPLG